MWSRRMRFAVANNPRAESYGYFEAAYKNAITYNAIVKIEKTMTTIESIAVILTTFIVFAIVFSERATDLSKSNLIELINKPRTLKF